MKQILFHALENMASLGSTLKHGIGLHSLLSLPHPREVLKKF
ncbi:hypothetical protein STRDD12_00791 [Streptococcus sp. DD12]|nr:hypothetical protein STRDD12_00791 [Streptococcus sp. DD12]